MWLWYTVPRESLVTLSTIKNTILAGAVVLALPTAAAAVPFGYELTINGGENIPTRPYENSIGIP